MTIRLRTAFFITMGFLILWLLYLERAILTPFILAAIFAYIFNPLVNFLFNRIKVPRTLSVIIIYLLIIGAVVSGGLALSERIVKESSQLEKFISSLTKTAKLEINNLPEWVKPTAKETLSSFDRSKLIALSPSIFALFPQAISRIISFVIFLFSAFYFLKEGRNIVDKFLNFIPNNYRIEVEILIRKINAVLGGYLRGQLFLIFLMSTIFFIILSIFGVKFALILAVFSGIAEIVPFIGPIVATSLAGFVAFTSQSSNFGLTPFHTAIAIIVSYTLVRQIQDYFITPYVMGKITKLHPLIILFAVLAGGHLLGFFGLILAVPLAGIARVLIEFSFDKVRDQENPKKR